MSKNYDLIATVDIDVKNPIVDDTSFDNLLIVGSLPAVAPSVAPASVGVYSSLEEVTAAGWKVTGDTPDIVGIAAQVAFSQSPRPNKIYIAPIQKVVNVEESVVDTVKRAMDVSGWYAVCPVGVSDANLALLAAYVEAQEKIMVYTEVNFFTEEEPAVGNDYMRSIAISGNESSSQVAGSVEIENKCLNVAFTAKWLSNQAGSETTAFKTLYGVSPSTLSRTEIQALDTACINYFITVGNRNITMGGKTLAGEWADVIRFRDYLKNDMQVRVVNMFVTANKIPYTDAGIALVQNQMIAALRNGQIMGGIAGDEYDEFGNVIPGYSTSVPLASSLSASQRASRRLINCKFAARLAGAIHFAEIKGSLTYTL